MADNRIQGAVVDALKALGADPDELDEQIGRVQTAIWHAKLHKALAAVHKAAEEDNLEAVEAAMAVVEELRYEE